MRCPFCSSLNTRVVDSRLVGEGEQIRRRRECDDCRERYTTYETAELSMPRVVKADARRELFDEGKLRSGMERALRKRPVPADSVERAVASIKKKLRLSNEREVDSRRLGEWVMEELRALDQVAYVRFASVYRSFEDVQAFRDEIELLERDIPPDVKRQQLDLLSEGEDAGG
ncbi:MAG: transcriptional regulator NrdR [Gammaproteobacteria bacterium]|nr:transcriptional regulator NrdR [Gammaproteobacteria bacterium]